MCKRLKLISEDNKWRIPMVSGLFAFTLGLSCFGVAFKLSEYQESLSLPPMLAGVPILIAGISGMVGGRMRKKCMISLHLVFCLIAGVLGLHLTFIFLGREAKSREIYKVKCHSQFKGAHYCHRYAATVGMTVLAVLPFALTPLGILSYAVTRRFTSRYNVNEEEEGEDTSTLDQNGDQDSTMSKMEGRLSSPTIDSEATTESKNKGKLLIKQYDNNNCNNSSPPSSYRESSRLVPDSQSHGENGQWPSFQVSGNAIPGNHGLQKQLSNGEAKFRKQGSCSQPPSSHVASRDHLVGRDSLQGYEPQRNQSSNEEAQINQLPRNQRRTNQERGKHKPSNHLAEKQVSRYKPRTNQELCNNTANNQTFINHESENYGSRNHGVSIQPSNVQMPKVLPTTVPISHLCSSQPSQNQNAGKPVLQPPTNHRRSKQIPNNQSTSYQVSSDEKRRSQAPHEQYPISNQSNQISRYYNPTTVDQQTKPLHLDGKQIVKDQQAFCKDMSRRQTPHYPYLPRNHPLRNQVPSHDRAPKSGE